jgi:cell division transport system ATP-binding protein
VPGLVVLQQVEKRYGAFRIALSGIDLDVARGEFVALCGPGGAGKSTLLRLISGIETPSAGTVSIAGENLARLRARARAHLRRSMGILPPTLMLREHRSVLENVALPARVAGSSRAQADERARAALERVGLPVERFGVARCADLAGGERRRAALARALANNPALLLLDEPTADLDREVAARVMDLLVQFSLAGVTVIAALREAPSAARVRVLSIADGRLRS